MKNYTDQKESSFSLLFFNGINMKVYRQMEEIVIFVIVDMMR